MNDLHIIILCSISLVGGVSLAAIASYTYLGARRISVSDKMILAFTETATQYLNFEHCRIQEFDQCV